MPKFQQSICIAVAALCPDILEQRFGGKRSQRLDGQGDQVPAGDKIQGSLGRSRRHLHLAGGGGMYPRLSVITQGDGVNAGGGIGVTDHWAVR